MLASGCVQFVELLILTSPLLLRVGRLYTVNQWCATISESWHNALVDWQQSCGALQCVTKRRLIISLLETRN